MLLLTLRVCLAAVLGEKKHGVISLDAVSIIAGEPGDAMEIA